MLLQFVGSLLVLSAFVALARGRVRAGDTWYLLANVVGASLLAVDALHLRAWGFLALEVTWAVVSAQALARASLSRPSARPR